MDIDKKLIHLNLTANEASRKQKIAFLKLIAVGAELTAADVEKIFGPMHNLVLSENEMPAMTNDELIAHLDGQSIGERQRLSEIKMVQKENGNWYVWFPKNYHYE